MKNVVMPTSKGQITIPSALRKKYAIDDNTSIRFIDKGNGIIEIKILRMSEAIFGEDRSDEKWDSLSFNKPVDPQLLVDAIKKLDGTD